MTGNFATQLVLEAPLRLADGGGGFELGWEVLGTLWADVAPVAGALAVVGGREGARVTHKVTLRAVPVGSPRRPNAAQRLRNGARVFAIHGVADDAATIVVWVEEGVLS